MPFGYFGAKHGLARFYSPPLHDVVIEPFCGSAAYSVYWAKKGKVKHAILRDTNVKIVELWRRLKFMSEKDLDSIPDPVKGERTVEPLIAAASAEQGMAVLSGRSRQVTERMVKSWPNLKSRIREALPFIRDWDVEHASYDACPDIEATWFIDPPYGFRIGEDGKQRAGGVRYHEWFPQDPIDYKVLAAWSMSRKGQVIVCEQHPASWLPFVEFRRQTNNVGAGTRSIRTEVVFEKGA